MATARKLTLSDKGQPKADIVLPENAGEILRRAAADLRSVLEKIRV